MRKEMKLSTKAIQIALLVCIALLMCVISFSLLAEEGVAQAEEVKKTTFEKYIQDDYMQNMTFSSNKITIFANDPIVDFIPIEMFKTPGQSIYVGEDYGYYIFTFEGGEYNSGWNAQLNMRSIVLGFEIEYEAEGTLANTNNARYTIRPVFQREYITLIPNGGYNASIGDYSYGGAEESKEISTFLNNTFQGPSILCAPADGVGVGEGLVAPMPQRKGSSYVFEDVNVFYLENIAVNATIENEQDLNASDSGYAVDNDNGAFMIGPGFEFEGVVHNYSEDDSAGWAAFTADAALHKLVAGGATKSVVLAAINSAWDVLDYITGSAGYRGGDSFESVSSGSHYGLQDMPNTKSGQVEACGGLYKAASVASQAVSEQALWVGNGGKFTAVFEVGGSTGMEPGWRTVVRHNLGVKVTSLLTDLESVSASSEVYTNVFNDFRNKPLSEGIAAEAYIMPESGRIKGIDKFSFTPEYSGFYELTVGGASGINTQVTSNGEQTVCTPAADGRYYMSAGEEYIITLTNTTSSLKRPTIKIDLMTLEADFGDAYSFMLPAGGMFYAKVDFANPFTRLAVQGTGMKLTAVLEDFGVGLKTLSCTEYDIKSDNVGVICITNTSASSQNGTVSFSDVVQIAAGGTSSVDVGSGVTRYVRFVPEAESYMFSYDSSSTTVAMSFYAADGGGVIESSVDDYILVTGLDIGSSYWIGLTHNETSAVTVAVTGEVQSGTLKWAVNGEVINGNTYAVYEGQEYNIGLLINGEIVPVDVRKEENTGELAECVILDAAQIGKVMISGYYYGTPATFKLEYTIENQLIVGDSQYDLELSLNLNIFNPVQYVIANNSLEITDTWSDETTVTVYVRVDNPLIEQFDYKVTYKTGLFINREITDTVSVGELSDENIITFVFQCADLITYNPLIEITEIVYDGYEYAFSSSATDSSFTISYAKGTGTSLDPYIINSNQHYATFMLGAISDASNQMVTYWKLAKDLDISSFNGGIPSKFYGVFDGDGYTLSGLTLEISAESFTSDQNYGWFEENYGTVKNVKFSDVTITGGVCHNGGWVNVGVVAGTNHSGAVIRNVELENVNISIDRSLSRIGGIAGLNEGEISDCTAGHVLFGDPQVTLFSNGDLGIICGENRNLISGCQVFFVTINYYPSVNDRSVGGIAGYCSAGKISDCTVWFCTINVTGTDANICPKIGSVAGHVTNKNMLVNNTAYCNVNVSKLSDAQKVNCCTDGSRQYGLEG